MFLYDLVDVGFLSGIECIIVYYVLFDKDNLEK